MKLKLFSSKYVKKRGIMSLAVRNLYMNNPYANQYSNKIQVKTVSNTNFGEALLPLEKVKVPLMDVMKAVIHPNSEKCKTIYQIMAPESYSLPLIKLKCRTKLLEITGMTGLEMGYKRIKHRDNGEINRWLDFQKSDLMQKVFKNGVVEIEKGCVEKIAYPTIEGHVKK